MSNRPFSLELFYQRNRRVLMWVIFFALLYLLREFFGLIFLTYVLALLAARLGRLGETYLHLRRRPALILVYACFLLGLGSFAAMVMPHVLHEAYDQVGHLPDIEESLIRVKNEYLPQHEVANRVFMVFLAGLETDNESSPAEPPVAALPASSPAHLSAASRAAAEDQRLVKMFLSKQAQLVQVHFPGMLKMLYSGTLNMLLALLFSFLIMLDTGHLARDVESLRLSRLRDFYEQTAQPVVRFAWVVGRAIEAQAVIAFINTIMTVVGLILLKIPSLAMLSLIVFLCSFIPVLGAFISTIPIALVALNSGGMGTVVAALVLVIVIHIIVSYFLSPLIYGHQLKLNPVLVLIILLVGHHAFGLWGMLLGVPVTYYVLHDVFGVPFLGEEKPLKPQTANAVELDAEAEENEG